MIGEVKRLVREKGFGFIRDPQGTEWFFHKSAIKNADFTEFTEGSQVDFESGDSDRGPRARDVYLREDRH